MEKFITNQLLKEFGYKFDDEEYEKMFVDFINKELTQQVGISISRVLTSNQMKEVKELSKDFQDGDIDAITTYLAFEVPNYFDIVESTVKRFYILLKNNRNLIMKKYKANIGRDT